MQLIISIINRKEPAVTNVAEPLGRAGAADAVRGLVALERNAMLMSQIENESQPQEERSLFGFLTGVALPRRHPKKLLTMFFLSGSSKPLKL